MPLALTLRTVLLLLAVIVFLFAAGGVSARVNLPALGLALFAAAVLVT